MLLESRASGRLFQVILQGARPYYAEATKDRQESRGPFDDFLIDFS